MARSAVLAGRTLADLVRNVFVIAIMVSVGFLVGWRVHTRVLVGCSPRSRSCCCSALAELAVRASSGCTRRTPRPRRRSSFPILAPLVFVSTAFVSAASMPAPLEWFAEHQPVSIVIDAVRSLTYGGQFADPGKVLERDPVERRRSSRYARRSRSASIAARLNPH